MPAGAARELGLEPDRPGFIMELRGYTLRDRALAEPKLRQYVDGKQLLRVIVVPDKLINLVVE